MTNTMQRPPSPETSEKWFAGLQNGFMQRAMRLGMPLLLAAVLIVYGLVAVDGFATFDNLIQVIRSQSLIGIAAVGMTFIVISGNFVDLSVPAVVAVAANVVLSLQDVGVIPAVLIALLLGVIVGLVNGSIVAYLGINSVITTLGIGSIVAGLLLWRTGAALSRGSSDAFNEFIKSRPLGVPVAAWVFLILILAGHFVMTRTRFGAQIRTTGGNVKAAIITGVPANRITVLVFVLMGVAAAIAGILLGGFADQADVAVGTGFEFDALIAVVIGGTVLTGGVGGFGRTLLGVLLLGIVNDILLLEGAAFSVQLLSRGALFLLVVVGDQVIKERRGQR
ncbi:MAG: ABC transporter permease [Actinomycetota bacterium]